VSLQLKKTSGGLWTIDLPVKVKGGRTWQETVLAGAPNTSERSDIWKYEDCLFLLSMLVDQEFPITVSLFGYDRNWTLQEGCDFAATNCLVLAGLREVLAVGESYPNLCKDLGKDAISIISIKGYGGDSIRAPGLWMSNCDERAAFLKFFNEQAHPDCFFAVRR